MTSLPDFHEFLNYMFGVLLRHFGIWFVPERLKSSSLWHVLVQSKPAEVIHILKKIQLFYTKRGKNTRKSKDDTTKVNFNWQNKVYTPKIFLIYIFRDNNIPIGCSKWKYVCDLCVSQNFHQPNERYLVQEKLY